MRYKKGNYRVVIATEEDGNWVLTAFDKGTFVKEKKKRKDAAAAQTPGQPDEGAGAVAPNLSEGKGSERIGDRQISTEDRRNETEGAPKPSPKIYDRRR